MMKIPFCFDLFLALEQFFTHILLMRNIEMYTKPSQRQRIKADNYIHIFTKMLLQVNLDQLVRPQLALSKLMTANNSELRS